MKKRMANALRSLANWLSSDTVTEQGQSRNAHASDNYSQVLPEPKPPEIRNLNDALFFYRRSNDSITKDQLALKVNEFAVTFDDWAEVSRNISSSDSLYQRAVEKISSLAVDFGQYESACHLVDNQYSKDAILEKMVSLAISVDDKLTVYSLADPESPLGQRMFQEITSASSTYDECDTLFQNASAGSSLERFAITRMIEIAETLESLSDLVNYDQIMETDLLPVFMMRLRGFHASFEEWQEFVSNNSGEVETVGVEKMIEMAVSIEEMLEVAEMVNEEDGTAVKFMEKAEKSFVWTDEDCRKILEDCGNDYLLFIVALKKLLENAKTTSQCLSIYFEWDFDDEGQAVVFEKLASLITQSECEIVALVAVEGSDLRDWAEEQVSKKK